MRQSPPTLTDWKVDMNNTLPYTKFAYKKRGCPAKYEKIWDRWLSESDTCTDPTA